LPEHWPVFGLSPAMYGHPRHKSGDTEIIAVQWT
jgi:hypothetical protein